MRQYESMGVSVIEQSAVQQQPTCQTFAINVTLTVVFALIMIR